ncbi:glycosyltransferase [Paenibacillus sp. YN15]|uniref:glycosyltransferase n=1 Tax=Paenibacillus sp. YN15 TaxID=1742774 RepID=UPI000DCF49CA|nr:glycosyltransferase [Paenibacillus sp. YN15]RAV04562.1 glycosyltransferase [Paenibacillus sp. YN15]
MGKPGILIGSPIRQKPEILKQFLRSLGDLITDGFDVEFYFVDDNDDPASRVLLAGFAEEHPGSFIQAHEPPTVPYVRNDNTHHWPEELVWKVAGMKDGIIEYARSKAFDYLFLADSDLVLHPHTLLQLANAKKDIVSTVFWTKWQPDSPEMPQVWMSDHYTLYENRGGEKLDDQEIARRTHEFLNKLRVPGLYEVGGLGACTLISRHALEAGVCFRKIPNLSLWGEDRHFCIRSAALGLSLFVDTHLPAYHIYRDSDLAGVDAYRQASSPAIRKERSVTVSLCMIVKNEEEALERCLSSVKDLVDEIVIADTGSTDKTREVAASFGAVIVEFPWIDDFAAARNHVFSKATKEYIMWLDADDIILAKDRQLLAETLYTLNPAIDSVTMPYNIGVNANGKVSYSLRRNRIVRRERGFRWIGAVHEYLEVFGNIVHSEAAVTHRKEKAYTDRNLQIYRKQQAAGKDFSIRDLYYFANELRDNQLFEEAAVYYKKFLATGLGWVEDQINACLKLSACYSRMYEQDKALQALFRSFHFDKPRAEACCRIGKFFYDQSPKRLDQAIYWYELATVLPKPKGALAFVEHDAWTWLPLLNLCLCYDQLGQYEKANEYNNRALAYNPEHPSMLHNKKYFEGKFAKEAQ